MEEFSLRKGRVSDATTIAELLIRSWQENYSSFLPKGFLDNMDLAKQITRHTEYLQGKATYYVAENALGNPVGFCSYGSNREPSYAAQWELYTIYVASVSQGKGLGYTLLQWVLKDIPDLTKGLTVWVMSQNPFKQFYVKQGFIRIAEEALDFGGFELMHEVYLLKKKN